MKLKKVISIIMIIALVCVFLSGCWDPEKGNNESNNNVTIEENKTSSVCFIIGNTKNVKQVDVNVLKEELNEASDNKSYYSVIVIDGKPNEISLEGQLNSSNKLFTGKEQNDKLFNETLEKIIHCEANDKEIDILAALDIAAKTLEASDTDEKKMVVFSSGISTSGILDFYEKPDLLFTSTDEIVQIIKNKHGMPDLSDIDVVWYGLNHVDDAQEELNSFELYKLRSLWSAILKEAGVKFEDDSEVFNEKASSVIDETDKIDKSNFEEVHSVEFKDVIAFSEEEFGFVSGEYTLLDENKTKEILEPVAEDIINMGYPEFYIIGSTASAESNEYCLNLSKQRAEVIKDILCEFGVSESCLKIYGIGREYIDDDYTWRIKDLDNNGNLIPDKAQMNRKVMFIPADSKAGRKFNSDFKNYFN